MHARHRVATFLLVVGSVIGGALAGCSNPKGLDAIQVTPSSESINTGQTAQLTAIGTFGNAKRPQQQNLTTGVTWSSNKPSVATVDNGGLVTAVGAGTATIMATADAFNGQTTSSAVVTVIGQGGGGSSSNGGTLLSLTIIPSSISVGNLQGTGNFLAIGAFSVAPYVRDLTNSPNTLWLSSTPNVFPVNTNTGGNAGATAGIVSAYGTGSATITVEATNPTDGSIQTATATFSCPLVLPNPPTTPGSCFPGSEASALLSTLTVYHEGLGTGKWRVTASSATEQPNPPNVLDCGSDPLGGTSICTATYPPGASVTLTATDVTGGTFGGWSSNCLSQTAPNDPKAPGAQWTCTVSLATDETVGVIFDNPFPPTQ